MRALGRASSARTAGSPRASSPVRSAAGRSSQRPGRARGSARARSAARGRASRSTPRTAATWPWGTERSIASASSRSTSSRPASTARIPSISRRHERGDVAERLVFDLAVLAVGAAQQRRLVGLALVVTTGDGNVDSPGALGHDRIMPQPPDTTILALVSTSSSQEEARSALKARSGLRSAKTSD